MRKIVELRNGGNYILNQYLGVKNLTIGEIEDMGYHNFEKSIYAITKKPYDDFIILSENNIDYREVDDWEYFLEHFEYHHDYYVNCLNILTTYDWTYCKVYNDNTIRDEFNSNFIFDSVIYRDMLLGFDIIYNYSNFKEKEKMFGNFNAIKYYAKQKKKKIERQMKRNKGKFIMSNTEKLVSFMSWVSPSINTFNIRELNSYVFYEGIKRINKIYNYLGILDGIYSGTIKQDKLDYESIYWMN